MRVKALLLAVALLGLSSALAEETEVPPLELLEYLGEWEDREGQWVDPQLLQLVMPRSEEQVNEDQNDE